MSHIDNQIIQNFDYNFSQFDPFNFKERILVAELKDPKLNTDEDEF